MTIQEFLSFIKKGEIPPRPPSILNLKDFSHYGEIWEARKACTDLGMWAIVTKSWVRQLSSWIGKRTVLEIMAGAGWLAKALTEEGISIIATDNHSWKHNKNSVFPVKKMDAIKAVKTIEADILLVSWPPYDNNTIVKACRFWEKPIIYIGEGEGGCNAPDEFFKNFKSLKKQPLIAFPSWSGIHDDIMIGKYKENS